MSRFVLVAVAVVALVGVPAVLACAGSADEGDAVALLQLSAEARTDVDFRGLVTVEWVDVDGTHRKQIAVEGSGGWIELGHGEVAGTDSERFVRDGSAWARWWAAAAPGEGPDPSDKWALRTTTGPDVAGRSVTVVAAADESNGDVRAEFSVDERTGMLLRVDLFDADGELERRVAFTSLTIERDELSSQAYETRVGQEPEPIDELPEPFRAPDELGDGYVRAGAYTRDGGEVHCFYSDGLFSASVFEQEGSLDADDLPSGWEAREIDGRTVHLYRTPGGPLAVWEDDGIVYTLVSDAPSDELPDLVDDLDGGDDRSGVEELIDTLTRPFRW